MDCFAALVGSTQMQTALVCSSPAEPRLGVEVSRASVPEDSAEPGDFGFRGFQGARLVTKDPDGMAADGKPSARVFDVASIFLKTHGSFRPQKDIHAEGCVLVVD